MRELLAKHHVTQMTMKPVKREYAFEDPAVRHGKQWVLKVRTGEGRVGGAGWSMCVVEWGWGCCQGW